MKRSCDLCGKVSETSTTGKLFAKAGVAAHQNCMLFSAALVTQNSADFSDFGGFLLEDVKKEIKRGRKLKCSLCKKYGATVGCEVKSCRKSYHYQCAVKDGAKVLEEAASEVYEILCKKHKKTANEDEDEDDSEKEDDEIDDTDDDDKISDYKTPQTKSNRGRGRSRGSSNKRPKSQNHLSKSTEEASRKRKVSAARASTKTTGHPPVDHEEGTQSGEGEGEDRPGPSCTAACASTKTTGHPPADHEERTQSGEGEDRPEPSGTAAHALTKTTEHPPADHEEGTQNGEGEDRPGPSGTGVHNRSQHNMEEDEEDVVPSTSGVNPSGSLIANNLTPRRRSKRHRVVDLCDSDEELQHFQSGTPKKQARHDGSNENQEASSPARENNELQLETVIPGNGCCSEEIIDISAGVEDSESLLNIMQMNKQLKTSSDQTGEIRENATLFWKMCKQAQCLDRIFGKIEGVLQSLSMKILSETATDQEYSTLLSVLLDVGLFPDTVSEMEKDLKERLSNLEKEKSLLQEQQNSMETIQKLMGQLQRN